MVFDAVKILGFSFLLIAAYVQAAFGAVPVMQSTTAAQAILVDVETGTVLFDKNSTQRMPTSSMSKVMTMYMVFEALREGRLSLSDKLPVSTKAWKKGGSKMFIEVGKKVKVEDLVRGVIVQSGNDATIALAEGLVGSEEVFAETMTMRAHSIGMKDSNFKNASGWPDPEHYSTARDLAILAQRMITNFPEYYHYYSETEFTYSDIRQANRNPLLYRNMGVDGIKTGHTEDGGYGLMASAERSGRRLVLVINGLPNEKARAQESARLLEWGFQSFEILSLFDEGEKIETASVWLGQPQEVPLVIEKGVRVSVPSEHKQNIRVTAKYSEPLPAPVAKGDEIGTVIIEIPGLPKQQRKLFAGQDVGKLGAVPSAMAKLRYFLFGEE